MTDITKPLSLKATHLFKGLGDPKLAHNTPVAIQENVGAGSVKIQTLKGKMHIVPYEMLYPIQG